MIDPTLLVTGLVIAAAVVFDFVNGFHDAANSIATIVATRVLKPVHAVLWAAFFNFLALFLFGTGVAQTIFTGMINIETITPYVVLAGLLGAISWGLITWRLGLPTSSTHALLGGYAGAAMTNNILLHGWNAASQSIIVKGWIPTLAFIVLAPVLGMILAQILMKLMMLFAKTKTITDRRFGHLQLFSSAFLSVMHGSNDAQKTAGIIAAVLFTGKITHSLAIPAWVLWISYSTMALGTLAGGWRIVNTMGRKLTRLNPASGFCAESAAGASILLATLLHLPVSTTHTTTGAIVGVGAARRLKAVRWSLAGNIVRAWIFTIPAAAAIGSLVMVGVFLMR